MSCNGHSISVIFGEATGDFASLKLSDLIRVSFYTPPLLDCIHLLFRQEINMQIINTRSEQKYGLLAHLMFFEINVKINLLL